MDIDAKLAELGLTLPKAAAPVAAYVPAVEAGGVLHLSGQICFTETGELITGRLDTAEDVAKGQEAAKRCALMLVAQIKAALGGSLDRGERVVKLGGFVGPGAGFN